MLHTVLELTLLLAKQPVGGQISATGFGFAQIHLPRPRNVSSRLHGCQTFSAVS